MKAHFGVDSRSKLIHAVVSTPANVATVHFDIGTEQQVTVVVKALGLTRMIIAHRPETIGSAPRRLVLCDGELHELHESLLAA
jgi:ATP-binding cassette subfamily B protein RaxB